MLRHGALTVLILMGAAPLGVASERLPIDGTFGNAAGCKLASTGNYGEDDSARILTSENLETMVTSCAFDKISLAQGPRFRVSLTCASEGEGPEENYQDKAEISGDPVDGYAVHFADGTKWEPLKRCE